MKEMPTAVLPADSEYVYQPDSDTWIVQKKAVNKKLSKKDNPFDSAICPSCGEWKPTDFTPEELKEREWECLECANKRLTDPQSLPENRGQKEITTFDPEYEWLLKLINVVTHAGVPAQVIKELSMKHPFVTVDDAGDLAAQIWTLAVDKYGIPREWLMKKLPKKMGSLNKKAEILSVDIPRYGLSGHATSSNVSVLVDPTPNEINGLLNKSSNHQLRYLLDNTDGKMFVWDAYYSDHHLMALALQESGDLYDVDDVFEGFIREPEDVLAIAGSLKKAYEGGYPTEEDATTWGAAAPGTYAYQPKINHDSTTGLREGDDGKPITICPKCKSKDIEKYNE